MRAIRSGVAAGALLAGLAGALGLLALRGGPAGERAREAGLADGGEPGLAAEVEALRGELRAERESGRALALEVAELRARLDGLAGSAPAPEPDAVAGPVPGPAAPPPGPAFDAGKLLESGLGESEVARLAEIHDGYQLDQVYLRNQAAREGWLHTPRLQHESRALENELRSELGELDYDRLLWASGRPNRVALAGVLARSPAEQAGLAPGDLILRYDDRPIFELHDLVTATTEGEAGAQVPVEVSRSGERLRLYLPRGPLGTHIVPAREPPEAE